MKQLQTLSIIEKDDKVLLAMKKRGFGKGWWNGYGGKVEDGETVEDAAIREVLQESRIIVKNQKKRGVIEFKTLGDDKIIEMHIFEVTEYENDPIETEEMKPQWFNKNEIPFDKMWPADQQWLPLFFEGKNFKGEVVFDRKIEKYIKADIQIIDREIRCDNEFRKEGRL